MKLKEKKNRMRMSSPLAHQKKNPLKNLLRPERILFFTLIISPWLFGAVETWAKVFLFCLILFGAFIWWRQKTKLVLSFSFPLITVVLLILFWLFLELIPLPPTFIQFLSPKRYELEKTVLFLLEGSSATQAMPWIPLSINPSETFPYILEFCGIILFGFIVNQIFKNFSEERDFWIYASLLNGSVLSIFAIIQRATSNGKLFWFRTLTQGGDPFGPYVNRTHLGGLLLLFIPLGIGFLLYKNQLNSSKTLKLPKKDSMVKSLQYLSIKDLFEKLFFPFLLLIISSGILISRSRGAMVSMLLAISLMGLWLSLSSKEKKMGRKHALLVGSFIVASITMALWMASDIFIGATQRLVEEAVDIKTSSRIALWKEAMELWRMFPLTGSGLGTFEEGFNLVRTVFPGAMRVTHAESDYVELLTDSGLVGFLLFLGLILIVLYKGWKNIIFEKDQKTKFLLAGGYFSFIGGLLQGIANFNLVTMANLLYLVFCAQLFLSNSEENKDSSV
ncbi:O-antigen ligase family protein [Methylacidiphilum fumariolicum]|nr:O-antigen ligase family protein [Candidatus Methylacidiphilum fumarolicum]